MGRKNISVPRVFMQCLLISGVLLTTFSCRKSTPSLVIPQLVKTTEVKEHKGSYTTSYPGKIQAASDVKLSFRVAGPIRKIYVKEGEYVKKGQLLAELDPRDYQLQYDATKAEYNQVKGESDRVIELYNRNSVPVNDYDKAVAAIKRISALYDAHRNALEDTKLKAPFSGYIQKKYFDTYEIVNQGLPVLSMIGDNYLEVDIDIPSSDYVRSDDFVGFYCTADVYPGVALPLEYLDINRKANFNQLFKVRFRIKEEEGLKLAAGMSVSVTIDYAPASADLAVIPISALFRKNDKSYVWLYDTQDNRIKMSPVEVQQILKDGEVIVRSALRKGQTVVSAGVNSLKEGQQVKRLPSVSSSNVGGLL